MSAPGPFGFPLPTLPAESTDGMTMDQFKAMSPDEIGRIMPSTFHALMGKASGKPNRDIRRQVKGAMPSSRTHGLFSLDVLPQSDAHGATAPFVASVNCTPFASPTLAPNAVNNTSQFGVSPQPAPQRVQAQTHTSAPPPRPVTVQRVGGMRVARKKQQRRKKEAEEREAADANKPRVHLRGVFVGILHDLLLQMSLIFSECQRTRLYASKLATVKKSEFMWPGIVSGYHRVMTPHYDRILEAMRCDDMLQRNAIMSPFLAQVCTPLPEEESFYDGYGEEDDDCDADDEASRKKAEERIVLQVLRGMNLAAKWEVFCESPQDQAALFSYIHQLNSFARLCELLPPRMLKRIEQFAEASIGENSERRDAWRIGVKILRGLPEEERDQLYSNIEVVMNVVGGQSAVTEVMNAHGVAIPKINVSSILEQVRTADAQKRADIASSFDILEDDDLFDIDDGEDDDESMLAKLERHERVLEARRAAAQSSADGKTNTNTHESHTMQVPVHQ